MVEKLVTRNDVRRVIEQEIPVKLQGVVYDKITDAICALYETKD